ncbi:autotransporter outer membrane beta-barrel domain-containing protein [Microvirga solisilvae]|uniref:autotransporter family protein n=1 Tax=Microvirga solisilvae TaxID=2919498 RepID=UPI001FAEFF25|nr:autotransporter outer membrane beta-barrel domain-containing protein [Microvirga solisilvae]
MPIAEVTSGGKVVIEGTASVSGSVGYGVVGTGEGTSLVNRGTLNANGASLDAMEVVGNRHSIVNTGRVFTSGNSASALHALGNLNSLSNSGVIDTATGSSSMGLYAEGHRNTLLNTGTITTGGNGSEGLSAYGDGNVLTNDGTIVTTGAVANGMRVHGNGNTLINEANITTSGVEGRGIKVDAGTGNSVVNRGTIETSGERGYGIWVASKAGETTTVLNEETGIIRSWRDKVFQFGAGNESVQNFGVLNAAGGGAAADLDAGDDTFLIGATSRITGYVDAGSGRDTFSLGGSANASFDASLIGAGAQYRNFEIYEKLGTSTWTIDGNNGDVMPWHVREGNLLVTGSMGGSSMTVYDGALLGGNGTVGGIDARSGSTLSPGMGGIGSLAVTGNVLIANGTIYKIDLNASGESDRIVAGGNASVEGGMVQVNALPGSYRPGSRWTILTADGGVAGQFSDVTTNLVFFRPVLSKDSNNIYLSIHRIDDLWEEDELGSSEESPAPFDLGTILVHEDLFRAAVLCRLRCSTGGLPSLAATGIVMADYAADMPVSKGSATPITVAAPQATRDWALWAKAVGSWGSTDATTTSASVTRSTAGLVFGADMGFGSPYRLGIAGGYFSTNLDFASSFSSGNVESMHIGLYGSAAFGALNLRGGVAYAHHEVDTAFTASYASNRFSSSSDSFQAFGEIGYEVLINDRVMIEPFLGLAHVHIAGSGIEVEDFDLVTGRINSFDTTYSTLGARLIATIPTEAGAVTFKGLLGWRHAFGDTLPKATFSFVGDDRPLFITGAPIDRDSLIVEAGLNWDVSKTTTLSVSYTGAMGRRDQEHTVRGGLTVRF